MSKVTGSPVTPSMGSGRVVSSHPWTASPVGARRPNWTPQHDHLMRARNAPGSVGTTVAGCGRLAGPLGTASRTRKGPGDPPAGTVASAKRLGTARSDRGDAPTADAPARTVHVTPTPDEPEHRLDGFCWCQPTYEDVGVDGRLYIHRRFIDGPVREAE